MHILYVNKVSPRFGGGAEARILEVGKRLAAKGHRISVVCSATEPGLPDEEILDGIRIHYLHPLPDRLLATPWLRFYGPRLSFYFLARNLIRRVIANDVDILRDDISPFPTFSAVRLSRSYGIPTIATVHSLSKSWKRWMLNYGSVFGTAGYVGERWLRKHRPYSLVITDSKWARDSLAADWPASRLQWIPNGVDTEVFHPNIGGARPDQPLNIFYAGRFVTLKGHTTLIRAFAIAINSGLEAMLHLAGHGPRLHPIQNQIEASGLSSAVVFHGTVDKAEMPDLYRQMDLYVSPSRFEGLPVTLLEAMATGLPIISSDIEAIDGLLEQDYSVVVPPEDPQAMAEAILHMSRKEDLRAHMGQHGRRVAQERFSWDVVVQRELEVAAGCLER